MPDIWISNYHIGGISVPFDAHYKMLYFSGMIFALVGSIQAISDFAATATYNTIYPATLNFWPGFSFVLGAVIQIVPMAQIMLVYYYIFLQLLNYVLSMVTEIRDIYSTKVYSLWLDLKWQAEYREHWANWYKTLSRLKILSELQDECEIAINNFLMTCLILCLC